MPFNRQETKVKARRNEDMRTQKADLLLMNVDFLDENWERVRGRDIVIRDGVIVEIRKHGDSETVYEANETGDALSSGIYRLPYAHRTAAFAGTGAGRYADDLEADYASF